MDDLVLAGTIGIIVLFLTAVIFIWGAFFIAGLLYAACITGRIGEVIIIAGIFIVAGFLYMGCGIWLQKSDQI
jgi:hypothetical protein